MIISPLSRYRLSLVPVLIVFAAGLLVRLIDVVRLKQVGRAVAICCLVLASIIFQRWVLPLPEDAKNGETQFLDYWASARSYAAEKRYEEAAEEMGRLLTLTGAGGRRSGWIEQCEADYVTYRVHALIARGALEEAKAILDRGTSAWIGAFQARGFGSVYPLLNFGALYIRFDDPATAGYLLRRMLQLSPNDADADRARRLLASIAETGDE
jgi:tetratricopeptide (TPR) repeat protein